MPKSEEFLVSVLVCAYNEVGNLLPLYERLTAVFVNASCEHEIVIVDDGSVDGTRDLLQSLAKHDSRLKTIHLVRNFGQHAAFAAGLERVSGQVVIWMDADLQDVPEEIPKLIAKHQEGFPVVYAIREGRNDPLYRRLGSEAFFSLFCRLAGQNLPRGMSTFRLLDRKVVRAFLQLKERSRITAGLMGWLGYPYGCVSVRHEARHAGTSKYSPIRLVKLTLDSFTAFSYLPLRIASLAGLVLSVPSFLFALVTVLRKLIWQDVAPGYASVFAVILFTAGLQLFMLGIVGEYIARALTEVQGRPLFVVDDVSNLAEESP
jgi:glycosyltransferase involved in cell wall biosynthesis